MRYSESLRCCWIALSPILACLAVVWEANSVSGSRISWRERVRNSADVVARVHLLDRQDVEFEFEGKREICGYRYRANVIKAYKGPEGEIEFFGAHEDRAPGGAYLIVAAVFSMQERYAEVEAVRREMKGVERARQVCRVLASEAGVLSGDEMFVPFDEEAPANLGGGEWLRVPRTSRVALEPGIRSMDMTASDGPYTLLRWSDVEEIIRAAILNSGQQPRED